MAAMAVAPALAQEAPAPEPAQKPSPPAQEERAVTAASPILVIRQSALFTESSAARSISIQAAEAERRIDADLDKVGESLRKREKELSELKASLPKAEFDTRAAEFERDVRAFYARSQRERGLVDQAVGRARTDLRKAAERVLIEIMRHHGAQVMLDEEQVVLSIQTLDITQEAVESLNRAIPDIRLVLPETSKQGEP